MIRITIRGRFHFRSNLFTGIAGLCFFSGFLFISCTSQTSQTPSVVTDTADIWEKWQRSAHSDTYALERGPNTYCARCHSPRNWDPEAVIDPPPNCVSCKFEGEDRPRIAAGNPLVPESEWKDIGCAVCHPERDGEVDVSQVSWLDMSTGEYVSVTSTTELCGMCHRDTETLRHERDISQSAHAGYTCTDCHDPHSTVASCTATGCHDQVFTASDTVGAHNFDHQGISCVACHDGANLPVQRLEEEETWITMRVRELLGQTAREPYQSHLLQKTVDCERCHYAGNPWQLTVPVSKESAS